MLGVLGFITATCGTWCAATLWCGTVGLGWRCVPDVQLPVFFGIGLPMRLSSCRGMTAVFVQLELQSPPGCLFLVGQLAFWCLGLALSEVVRWGWLGGTWLSARW